MIEESELSGFMDGELESDRARTVEKALAADHELASKFAQLQMVDQILCKQPSAEPVHNASTSNFVGEMQTLLGAAVLSLLLVVVKIAIGSVEQWVTNCLEIALLGTLLGLAATHYQSIVSNDLRKMKKASFSE